jgi:hypothetical protein
MKPHVAIAILSFVAAAGRPGQTAAQEVSVAADCDPANVGENTAGLSPADLARLPSKRFSAESTLVVSGHPVRAISAMRKSFTSEQTTWPEVTRVKFNRELDSLLSDLVRIEARTAVTLNNDYFRPLPSNQNAEYTLFAYRPVDSIQLSEASPPSAIRRSICWEALAIHRVVASITLAGYARGAAVFADRVAEWDAFHKASYAQYPWERGLTNMIDARFFHSFDDLRPPRVQIILLHPGVGSTVTGSIRSWKKRNLRSSPTLWWEALGAAFYTRGYGRRFGGSLVLTAPESDGLGIGPMLHLSRYAMGYVFTSKAQSNHRGSLLMTIDLYKRLGGDVATPGTVSAASSASPHEKEK